ncbi:MAG: formate-dependent phosphoribosylglycinamide formyltransferase [Bacteroidetes bacterium]|nr:formate-dependent phosphoribosylglycinamide formyltransferase [Bacteroidota bacterium]
MKKKILLLGSGELGKEFVIAAKRLGQYVIAVDSYNDAPAQQVADEREVISMLDGNALDAVVLKHKPDIIVPEIEAIRTERFYDYEKQHIQVVPSARAANYTMNRKAIRDLAANELGLRTAKYAYAKSLEEFREAIDAIGIPCVVKPLMSSSGKGQSVVKTESEIDKAWNYAMSGSRGDLVEVIVEEFIKFESEITLLTITQKNGKTLFCPPIGHRQERGDYRESWMPHPMGEKHLEEAQHMADKVTRALSGYGIWGVEFFLAKDASTGLGTGSVYFSELSPRPHDTGMVTLANTVPLNEFELHLRAILGLPIPDLSLLRAGASAVVLAAKEGVPMISGLAEALGEKNADVKVFGKPVTRPYRRMAVALAWDEVGCDITQLVEKAKAIAAKVSV